MAIWSKDWQYMLRFSGEPGSTDENSIVPYALQFANCDRIEKNDAVYIFDEVGSGKTIMAGLMALHYLYNNPGQNVLVITTNALASGENGGQFLNDWYSKLPFDELGLKDRVEVINHFASQSQNPKLKADPSQFGLVIIDEAQVFLNLKTNRSKALTGAYKDAKNSCTEKVVFLTATPIKGSGSIQNSDREAMRKNAQENLECYSEIAKNMLRKEIDADWEELLGQSDRNSLICANFDTALPFTRYFKDTINNLVYDLKNKSDNPKKKSPLRSLPEIWEWNQDEVKNDSKQSKEFVLLEKISDILHGTGGRTAEPDARFVVFTKYVNKSKAAGDECADALYDYLTKDHKELKGFSKDDVAVVTGQKCVPQGASLADYSGTDEERLPRILILTYQIAEAGVNLPGFNYVVNYHISEYPSSLEQRFGRIDRWNSNYSGQQIHACYLYDKSLRWDTNTFNFHRAVKTAIDGLLPLLPSRNVILSREILDKHISERDKWEKRLNEIERLLNDLGYTAYKLYFEQKHGDFEEEIKQLIDFFEDTMDIAEEWRKIFLGCSIVSEGKFAKEAKRVIKILRDIGKDTFGRKMDLNWCKEVIEKFGNDIFYLPSNIEEGTGAKLEDLLKTITFEECLKSVREKMGEYLSRFYITCGDIVDYRKTEIKPLEEVLKKFEQELNQHFCDKFRQRRLEEVFPDYRVSFRREIDISRENDKIIEIKFEFYWDRIVYKIACHYAPEDTKIKFGTDAVEDDIKDVIKVVKKEVFGNRNENIAWRIKAQKDIFALNGASQNNFNLALIGKQYTLFALRQLPFFKMCNDFEMSLYENLFKKTGEPRYGRYNEDPFATACWEIREQAVNLGLMEEEPRNIKEIKDKYLSVTIDEGGVVTACAWYQLAAKLFIDHQELKKLNIYMLSCFCSNSAEVEDPKWKPAKRENVKWPWPDKTDFSALQVQCGDFLTEYFLNCFRKEEPDSQ